MPKPPKNTNLKTLILHNCSDVSKVDAQKFFEKSFVIHSVNKCDKIIFVEFNERSMAEDAMKMFYGKLVINVLFLLRIVH